MPTKREALRKSASGKEVWEMSFDEYYESIVARKACPQPENYGHGRYMYAYYLQGFPRRAFGYQESIDYAAYDKQHGHFFQIAKQVIRTRKLKYISAENFVRYQSLWNRLFREYPSLQHARCFYDYPNTPIVWENVLVGVR